MKNWLKENWVFLTILAGCALVTGAVVIAKMNNVPLTDADMESLKGFQSSLAAENAKHGFSNSMAIVEQGKHQVLVTADKIKQL